MRSGDPVVRLGGDEFVVLIEDLSAPAAADAALYAAKKAGRNTWQLLPTDDPSARH